jgi:ATP-dependent Zn protease
MKKAASKENLEKIILNIAKKENISIEKENLKDIKKSIYKNILKAIKSEQNKETAEEIVDDIKDPNNLAEVDNQKIPSHKENVLWKGKDKLKKFLNKRKNKK